MSSLVRQLWLSTPMMSGDDVMRLQAALARTGIAVQVDGIFGRATREAVLAFQRSAGLEADGLVGNATWRKLFGDGAAAPAPAAAAPKATAVALPDQAMHDIVSDADFARITAMHGQYQDGCRWQLTKDGVTIDGETGAVQDAACLALVQRVRRDFGQAMATALDKYKVPVELIIANMCTESGGRPSARRDEPGADLTDAERTPSRVSVGLMQTLLSTAREALKQPTLRLNDLLDPETSIRAGAAYIWRQGYTTHFDPPLVAAAYNAGRLVYDGSTSNRWRLRQYPIGTSAHCDRFVRFFNAAMKDAAGTPHDGQVPSWFRELTRS